MKTAKRHIQTNSLALRAIQMFSMALALLAGASWLAPTGHSSRGPKISSTSTSPTSQLSAGTTLLPPDQMVPSGTNDWSTNGPYGASINSLAIDPNNPATIYAGTEGRGVFKTTNGGASWSEVGTGLSDASIYDLVIDPSNSNILYANTSSGIIKSTNGGATWYPSGNGLSLGSKRPLIIDPRQTNILYVGTFSAIFKSVDGGSSWTSSSAGLGQPIVYALAIDPGNSNILYAGTGSNGLFSGGVSKSTDGGASWHSVSTNHNTVHALAVDPRNPNTLYGSTFDGLIKSTDGGTTWNASNTGLPTGIYPYPPVALVIDPSNSNNIYAGFSSSRDYPLGEARLFRSMDGGGSWQATSEGLSGDVVALAIDPSTPSTIYAGLRSGIYRSTDRAANWAALKEGMSAISVGTLVVDHTNANTIYAGTSLGVFKSIDGGTSWNASGLNPAALGLPSYERVSGLVLDPNNSKTIYACISGAGFGVFKSVDGGASWVFKRSAASFGDDGGFFAMAIDPSNSNTLYASGFANDYTLMSTYYFVEKTTDGGENWTRILNDGAGQLLVDSLNPNTIYLALWGSIGKSIDGGASWNYLNNGLLNTSINELALDPGNSNIIYAATGYQSYGQGYEQNHNTGVFKSTDGGVSWNAVGPSAIVLALAIDSSNPNTIYAGTLGSGVFKSTDGGGHWSIFNEGLTNLNVFALAVDASGNFLHAGTAAGVFDYQYREPCAYSISRISQSVPAAGATDSVSVTSGSGCAWQASSNAGWITINSGNSGNGNGTVNYSVEVNTGMSSRIGTLTIAGQTFTVTQAAVQPLMNPIDDAQTFVRQHYLDFLNRQPDEGGLAYWTNEINRCGTDARCVHNRRIGVSAAFFVEQEFQDTGYFVYSLYKASFGNQPTFKQFMPDRALVVGGPNLESGKQAFAEGWVARATFKDAYPATMSPEEFVNKLFDTAELKPYSAERQQLATDIRNGKSRALALREVIEFAEFKNREYNPAFVLMQYFGYLRRDPEQGGYDFWLDVLNNREPNNFRGMVCSFITSAEYQHRFGAALTRSNADCGP